MPKVHASRVARKAILASLSASAAGLVVGAEAQADIIVDNVNETVGFGGGSELTTYTVTGLPGASFTIHNTTSHHTHALSIVGNGGAINFRFGRTGSNGHTATLARAGAGKTYAQAGNVGFPLGNRFVAFFRTFTGGKYNGSGTSGSNIYALFKFTDTTRGGTDYGYLKGEFTNVSYGGLAFDIESVVYDNTGATILSGALPTVVPEPSSLVLGAMGALVMGAAGVRKWKQDKVRAASVPSVS